MGKAGVIIGAFLAVVFFVGLSWAQDNANEVFLYRIQDHQRLRDVLDISVDRAGNLYTASYKNILYMSPDGTVLNSKAIGYVPTFVKVGPDGRLYVGKGRYSVKKPITELNPIGEVQVFDTGLNYLYSLGSGSGEFDTPSDIDFDSAGNIYVCDMWRDVIKVFDPQGNLIRSFGQHGIGDGYLNKPQALAIDRTNNIIYIADKQFQPDPQDPQGGYFSAARIHAYSLDGQFLYAFGDYDTAYGLITPSGLALYGGRLYATDTYVPVVQVYDPQAGQFLYSVYDNLAVTMRTNLDLAITEDGLMYVASSDSDAIYVYGVGGYVTFDVSPSALSFTAQGSQVSPASATVQITNTGTGVLDWTATADASWLSLSQGSGSLAPGGVATLDVSVVPAGLSPGHYTASVQIASAGAIKTVLVGLDVVSPPTLSVTPDTLSFSAVFGGDNPPSQYITVSLTNAVSGTVWQASSDSSWLSINPVQAGPGDTQCVVTVNIAGLSPGQYTGHITLSSDGATGSPAVVTVGLDLVAAGTINVTTNLEGARFTITGPSGVQYSGSGTNWSTTGVPDGTYTIVFEDMPGYITPASQTDTLTGGGVLNFTGHYEKALPRIIVTPFEGDDKGGGENIKVFDIQGNLIASMRGLKEGMDVSAGDLDGDGIDEIVVGSMKKGSTVEVFSATGQLMARLDDVFGRKSKGLALGVGDLDGDGIDEIVAVERSKAEVKVLSLQSGGLQVWPVQFNGFDGGKIKGLLLSLADTDGDGASEVVLIRAARKRHHPVVRSWKISPDGAVLLSEEASNLRHIKAVTASDIDADGVDDLILYDGKGLLLSDGTRLFRIEDVKDMVASDLDDDGIDEIILSRENGIVDIYEMDGMAVGSFSAGNNEEDEGLSVSAGLLGY